MYSLSRNRKLLRGLLGIAVAQIIGWGTVGLLAIVGTKIGNDLGMDIATVFAGTSIFYVTMGICSPLLALAFDRFGTRTVMSAGSLLSSAGFCLLSISGDPVTYFSSWALLGLAGSATLTTPAYIALNEIAGNQARGAIGALMLATGLSSSLFWPATALISESCGWRGTCLIYAALLAMICAPLYAAALPGRPSPERAVPVASKISSKIALTRTFLMIVCAISLNAFVTFGLAATLIELLRAEGLPTSEAVMLGSVLGVIQVSARAFDLLGASRWNSLTVGIFAGATVASALVIFMIGEGTKWSVYVFILLYGVGSGALAVSRATIPLLFYAKSSFASASARIALPLNLISAASPPLLAAILSRYGGFAVLGVCLACAAVASALLVLLARLRQDVAAPAAVQ